MTSQRQKSMGCSGRERERERASESETESERDETFGNAFLNHLMWQCIGQVTGTEQGMADLSASRLGATRCKHEAR